MAGELLSYEAFKDYLSALDKDAFVERISENIRPVECPIALYLRDGLGKEKPVVGYETYSFCERPGGSGFTRTLRPVPDWAKSFIELADERLMTDEPSWLTAEQALELLEGVPHE